MSITRLSSSFVTNSERTQIWQSRTTTERLTLNNNNRNNKNNTEMAYKSILWPRQMTKRKKRKKKRKSDVLVELFIYWRNSNNGLLTNTKRSIAWRSWCNNLLTDNWRSSDIICTFYKLTTEKAKWRNLYNSLLKRVRSVWSNVTAALTFIQLRSVPKTRTQKRRKRKTRRNPTKKQTKNNNKKPQNNNNKNQNNNKTNTANIHNNNNNIIILIMIIIIYVYEQIWTWRNKRTEKPASVDNRFSKPNSVPLSTRCLVYMYTKQNSKHTGKPL